MQRRTDRQGLNVGNYCIHGGEWIGGGGEGAHSKSHKKPGPCGDMKAEREDVSRRSVLPTLWTAMAGGRLG